DQVRNAGVQTLLLSTAVSAGLAFAGYLVMGIATSLTVQSGMWDTPIMVSAALVIAAAAASSILIGWLVAFLSNRKFGFVNGDVLGAANEISKVTVLLSALIVIGFYTSQELPFLGLF
ncbi:MAG: adenosylcobinamide-GDP ribazoletransferase, partial [Methanomassiliicoccaceae archaeon]|nr:adenosylcobinamide-GDP ribazoletransferase [Methanomassiliicoccaceae archaeon]